MSGLPDTQNKLWAQNKSNFGFKMLEKMGWAEGKGLGRKEDGMSTHVRVKRRTENLALGAEADFGGNVALSSAVGDFDSLLSKLSATVGSASTPSAAVGSRRKAPDSGKESKGRSSSRDSDSDSDSDSDAAVGGAGAPPSKRRRADPAVSDSDASSVEPAKKSKKEKKGKKDKKEKKDKKDKKEKKEKKEKAEAARPASDGSGAPRVVSRLRANYHRNLRNKNVRAYGKEDLAAILGHKA